MEFGLYFGVGVMVGGVFIWIYLQWRHGRSLKDECRRLEAEICEFEDAMHGLHDFNTQMQAIKDNRKAKIVEWLRTGEVLQSSDIAQRLNISTRTARNYLTELVEEQLVLQSAMTGRDVSYQIVQDAERS